MTVHRIVGRMLAVLFATLALGVEGVFVWRGVEAWRTDSWDTMSTVVQCAGLIFSVPQVVVAAGLWRGRLWAVYVQIAFMVVCVLTFSTVLMAIGIPTIVALVLIRKGFSADDPSESVPQSTKPEMIA